MSLFLQAIVSALILTPLLFIGVSFSVAQVMESGSYRIQSDSLNFGGGFSSSTEYALESTGGEVGTGESSSTNYSLRAGYQQMQEVYIALGGFNSVIMTPAIGGITGGESNGSTTITVTTDSPSGYALTIETPQSPSLMSGANSIPEYVPTGLVPDFTFIYGASASVFGYSPEGEHIVSRYRDNGAVCGTDTGDTLLSCWDGLSTTARTIATETTSNHPTGGTTTIHFKVGVGGAVVQAPGTYVGTTTITALPL